MIWSATTALVVFTTGCRSEPQCTLSELLPDVADPVAWQAPSGELVVVSLGRSAVRDPDGTWHPDPFPGPASREGLLAVTGTSLDDVWAIGAHEVFRRTDAGWEVVPFPSLDDGWIYGHTMLGPGRPLVIREGSFSTYGSYGGALEWTGSQWESAAWHAYEGGDLYPWDVAALPDRRLVVATRDGVLVQDDTGWRTLTRATTHDLSVASDGTIAFLSADGLHVGDETGVALADVPEGAWAHVYAGSAEEIWVWTQGSETKLTRLDGPSTIVLAPLRDLTGDGTGVWAVGGGRGRHLVLRGEARSVHIVRDEPALPRFSAVAVDDLTGRVHATGSGVLGELQDDGRWLTRPLGVEPWEVDHRAVSGGRSAASTSYRAWAVEPDGKVTEAVSPDPGVRWILSTIAGRDGVLFAGGRTSGDRPVLVRNEGQSWTRILDLPGEAGESVADLWVEAPDHLWVSLLGPDEQVRVLEHVVDLWVDRDPDAATIAVDAKGRLWAVDQGRPTASVRRDSEPPGDVFGLAPLADGQMLATSLTPSAEPFSGIGTFGLHLLDRRGDWTTLHSTETQLYPAYDGDRRGDLATDGATVIAASSATRALRYTCP